VASFLNRVKDVGKAIRLLYDEGLINDTQRLALINAAKTAIQTKRDIEITRLQDEIAALPILAYPDGATVDEQRAIDLYNSDHLGAKAKLENEIADLQNQLT